MYLKTCICVLLRFVCIFCVCFPPLLFFAPGTKHEYSPPFSLLLLFPLLSREWNGAQKKFAAAKNGCSLERNREALKKMTEWVEQFFSFCHFRALFNFLNIMDFLKCNQERDWWHMKNTAAKRKERNALNAHELKLSAIWIANALYREDWSAAMAWF